MSRKTFKSQCERLQYRALRDGNGSESDRIWRKHACACKECQASMHILELLNQDSHANMHMPEESMTQLSALVQERYGKHAAAHKRHAMFTMFWKVGIVASVMLLAGHFLSLENILNKSVGVFTESIMSQSSHVQNDAQGSENAFIPAASREQILNLPEILPTTEMDQNIEEVKLQIDTQYKEFNELIDRDFNEF